MYLHTILIRSVNILHGTLSYQYGGRYNYLLISRRKYLEKNSTQKHYILQVSRIIYLYYYILVPIECINKLWKKKIRVEYYNNIIKKPFPSIKYFITHYIDEIDNESKRDWVPEAFYYPKVISRGMLIYDLIIWNIIILCLKYSA